MKLDQERQVPQLQFKLEDLFIWPASAEHGLWPLRQDSFDLPAGVLFDQVEVDS